MADESKPGKRSRRAVAPAGGAGTLEAMGKAVADAAGTGSGLWLSYLFSLFYLLIAVGSVTHRDLLLESPIKLPFLGIDLPLVGFFALGPLLFLIVHAYVLLHMALLAGKVGAFRDALLAQNMDGETGDPLRRQLPSNFLVQALAGPSDVRAGLFGFMLRLIGDITLVAAPIALLLFFQLQFLPYHHDWLTWWHRLAVTADLVLLWMLRPGIALGRATWISWRDLRRTGVAASALASLAVLLFAFAIATYRGERLDALPSVKFIPTMDPLYEWTSLHKLLVAGDVDDVTNKPVSLWSNRLVLPYADLLDGSKFDSDAKIAAVRETLSLRGRNLEGAVLIGARLRKADLTAANLGGALLSGADLRDSRLVCAGLRCANLTGASLDGAQLQGARLVFALLQDASLEGAELQGASLEGAELQGARLVGAQLQGARLVFAQLQGASLEGAQLQGASLDRAQL